MQTFFLITRTEELLDLLLLRKKLLLRRLPTTRRRKKKMMKKKRKIELVVDTFNEDSILSDLFVILYLCNCDICMISLEILYYCNSYNSDLIY